MPLTAEDQQVFEELNEAGRLYERYLEVAKIAQVPVTGTVDEAPTPPPAQPLTLVFNSSR